MNPFQVLDISENASDDEIKSAYRKLSKIHHPDVGGDPEKFKELNEAYVNLTNKSRKIYIENNPTFNYTYGYEFKTPNKDIFIVMDITKDDIELGYKWTKIKKQRFINNWWNVEKRIDIPKDIKDGERIIIVGEGDNVFKCQPHPEKDLIIEVKIV